MEATQKEQREEFERLLHLSGYDLDYPSLEPQFSNLAKIAAKIADTEISLVNIIDLHTQWSVGTYGFPAIQIPKQDSICQYTILGDAPYEVKDMSSDVLFRERFYVLGDPFLKYYWGIPLRDKEGVNVGSLCVMDKNIKTLSDEKVELLRLVANEVVLKMEALKMHGLLEQFRQNMESVFRKTAHDVRSPIGGIVSAADMLLEQWGQIERDRILEYLTLIQQTGTSVLELAEEILEAGNCNSTSAFALGGETFTTQVLKEKVLAMCQIQALAKDIEIRINALDDTNGDSFPKYKLLQIVGNLVSNAIKFTPSFGQIDIVLHLQIDGSSKKLVIKIVDSGVGMTRQKLEQVRKGNAVSHHGTKGERGFAFGLALVREMVKSLGGSFSITSQPLEGTTVLVEIHY
ncbi:GAF domain-containing sensor histidine kinase [Mariniradius sediminis]|uniref:histidine kinase n=1 Tax=Mariniradius sediminis TaxID=2909237 RepID=A0ABS9BSJ7_9BACT|nr:GAF domain-containing sensor histidine kinase [Mariniradius sediminis]MCF1751044.1 GAF domain-containing sensor histidine kinase [Mariniradius sediminis]